MVRPGRIAIGVAVLAAIIGLDWWVEGVLRQSEIRDRLAQLSARCESSFASARETLALAEPRRESVAPADLRVFAPIPPMAVMPSELEDPVLRAAENRLILLDEDARRYAELVSAVTRVVAGEATSASSAWKRIHDALAAHVEAMRLACDSVENELIDRS
ncbi:MAG: hypothetical protein O7G30_07275 [Proteobacteria bacterium]|nr:hypothetical protein [Pseudomonadota bacterium]